MALQKGKGPIRGKLRIAGSPVQFGKANPRKVAMRRPAPVVPVPRSRPPAPPPMLAASLPINLDQPYLGGGTNPVEPPPDPWEGARKITSDIAGRFNTAKDDVSDIAGGVLEAWEKGPNDKARRDFDALRNPINTGLISAVDKVYANTLNTAAEGELIPEEQAPGRREDLPMDIDTLQAMVGEALQDNTWDPEDRMRIVQNYRDFLRRWTLGDDSVREINNFKIVSEYRRIVGQARLAEDANKVMADTAPDGDFFPTFDGTLLRTAGDQYGGNLNAIIAEDDLGYYSIMPLDELITAISSEARANPASAAELITKLTAWGAYPGAQEKYTQNNVVFDGDGNPVMGRWTKDDQAALRTFLIDAIMQQAGGDERSWYQLLDEHAQQNQEVLSGGGGTESEGGGGGGGWRNYGGGGGWGGYGGGGYGGSATGVSYTDANELKQLINGVARSRLGYALNDAQIAEFVQHFHQQEAAFVNARIAGQSGMQLDPESQAAAWIESRFRDQAAGQSYNSFVSILSNFLLGGGQFGSST